MDSRMRRGDRWLAAAASLAAHGGFLILLVLSVRPTPASVPTPAVMVDLIPPPVIRTPAKTRTPTPAPASPAQASPAKRTRKPPAAKPRPAPAPMAARAADYDSGAGAAQPGLSDAELAGANATGEGSAPGGACDMARHVQAALRKDPLVRQQVVGAHGGRALLVWRGDWIQSQGEDGKGLSAVREAIMWEVAFAPRACRAEEVRGLITFSLGAGAPRLVLGQGQWRWSDLLRGGPTG
jgi:hypothetical protein